MPTPIPDFQTDWPVTLKPQWGPIPNLDLSNLGITGRPDITFQGRITPPTGPVDISGVTPLNIPGITFPGRVSDPYGPLNVGGVTPLNIPGITFKTQLGALPSTFDVGNLTYQNIPKLGISPYFQNPLPASFDVSKLFSYTGEPQGVGLPTQFRGPLPASFDISKLLSFTGQPDIGISPKFLPPQKQIFNVNDLLGLTGSLSGTFPTSLTLAPPTLNYPTPTPLDINKLFNVGDLAGIQRGLNLGFDVRPPTLAMPLPRDIPTLDPNKLFNVGDLAGIQRGLDVALKLNPASLIYPQYGQEQTRPTVDINKLFDVVAPKSIQQALDVAFNLNPPTVTLPPPGTLPTLDIGSLLKMITPKGIQQGLDVGFKVGTPTLAMPPPGAIPTLDPNKLFNVSDLMGIQRGLNVGFDVRTPTLNYPTPTLLDPNKLFNVGDLNDIQRNLGIGLNVKPSLNYPQYGQEQTRPTLDINKLFDIINPNGIQRNLDIGLNVNPNLTLSPATRMGLQQQFTQMLSGLGGDIPITPTLQGFAPDQLQRLRSGLQDALTGVLGPQALSIMPTLGGITPEQRAAFQQSLTGPGGFAANLQLNPQISGDLAKLLSGTIRLEGPGAFPNLHIDPADIAALKGATIGGGGFAPGGGITGDQLQAILQGALGGQESQFEKFLGNFAGAAKPVGAGMTSDDIQKMIAGQGFLTRQQLADYLTQAHIPGIEDIRALFNQELGGRGFVTQADLVKALEHPTPPPSQPIPTPMPTGGGDINITTTPSQQWIDRVGAPQADAVNKLINQMVDIALREHRQRFPLEGFLASRTAPLAARGIQDIRLPPIPVFDPYAGGQVLTFPNIPGTVVNPYTQTVVDATGKAQTLPFTLLAELLGQGFTNQEPFTVPRVPAL